MDHIVGHVVRRGVEYTTSKPKDSEPEFPFPKIPAWGGILLVSTSIFFVGLMFMIEYTYGRVIATLTMVESESGTLFEPLASDDPDSTIELDNGNKASTKAVEPELLLIKQQPITAKLRTAVKHLRARAGFWSIFRGFSLYLVYGFAVSQLTSLLSLVIPRLVGGIFASVVFARLRMGWTHIVISEPSSKPWYRRLPSIKLWKKIAAPTALLAVCEHLTVAIPVVFFFAMKLDQLDNEALQKMTCAERKWMVVKVVAVLVLTVFTAVAIIVPATVTLTRVQASLLSDEEETIVPFDRSFGGKVIPEIVGGSGMIGMLDAWKTFDWNSRVRLLKLYVKVFAMQIATSVAFLLVVAVQLRLIFGKEGMDKGAVLMNTAFAQKN